MVISCLYVQSPLSVMEDTLSRVSEPNSSIVDRSTDSDALDGGSDLESSINTLENTIVEKPCAATPDHYGGRSDDESFISNSTLKSGRFSCLNQTFDSYNLLLLLFLSS